MGIPKVILIGGAPMVGKSAAARQLAARLVYACLSTDDLNQAIRAATTPKSHPALHRMDEYGYREYYASHSINQLVQDADHCHQTLWEPIKEIIKAHATWGTPIVIEGWALQPERVAGLGNGEMRSLWLVGTDDLFESRIRNQPEFFRGASNEEQMIGHFIERSIFFNNRTRNAALKLGLPLVEVTESETPAEIRDRCHAILGLNPERLP